ncbi:MAG TPA: hypothetical protein VFH54_05385 [Mycobacteriales bacterium]|nr:hypothetical protein [Mycobacteriales bacterium]
MSDSPPSRSPELTEMLDDRFVRRSVLVAVHVRRHLPLYVIGVAVLLVATLMPTLTSHGGDGVNNAGATSQGVYGQSGQTGTGTGAAPGQVGSAAGIPGAAGGPAGGATGVSAAGVAGSGATGIGGSSGGPIGHVAVGTGITKGGFKCSKGVPQIPWSAYTVPCVAKFSGNNGGATYRGVTANQIVIADREFQCNANCQAVQSFEAQAGVANPKVTAAVAQVFLKYFNQVFDLYGRQVVMKYFSSSANTTDEAVGQGKAQACADADSIVNDMHAFGEFGDGIDGSGAGGSGPFSECAAQYKLVEFHGGAYYDEQWYRSLNPYVWNGIPECQRDAHMVAEQIAKEMNGPAKFAGDTLLQSKPRVFGTYIPNNPPYQRCAAITHSDLQNKYHIDTKSRSYQYNYVLDVSRFADQANQAIVQFHSEGVTTVVIACDPISPIFLTQSAASQNYHPEWYIVGTAANDFDTVPRLWVSSEIAGHLFGMGQLSSAQKIFGPKSEPGITYKRITGKTIPAGTSGWYFELLQLFNFLQATGPDLTPANMAAAVVHLPQTGLSSDPAVPKYAVGRVCFCTNPDGSPGYDHTGIDDTRIVYWEANATSVYDGKKGTYYESLRGDRFLPGQLPTRTIPVYGDDPR